MAAVLKAFLPSRASSVERFGVLRVRDAVSHQQYTSTSNEHPRQRVLRAFRHRTRIVQHHGLF